MHRLFLLSLLTASSMASAIVIRDDVDDAKYRTPTSTFPALVDLPHEGHGVLIASRWVVTAAHATQWHPVADVMLNGKRREVARVIVHTGYKALPQELQSGDAAPAMAWLAASDDIALIELAEPVTDIAPVALYRATDELGQRVKLIGKGATGNGRDGLGAHASHRTELRRAFNTISSADGRWLGYTFDSGAAALPLEGMSGNGDSGGPALIHARGQWQLAGLVSWVDARGDVAAFRPGLYGLTGKQVRISHYADWIDRTIATGSAQ